MRTSDGLRAGAMLVTAATVAGAATTGAAPGHRPPGGVALVLATAAVWVVPRRAITGSPLTVSWALARIAVETPATVVLIIAAVGLRLARGDRPARDAGLRPPCGA